MRDVGHALWAAEGQALLSDESPAARTLTLPGSASHLCSVLPPSPVDTALSSVPVLLTSYIPSSGWSSPKYVTLEQLRVMWGSSSVAPAPAPGLPPWASASRDLVPTSSFAPVPPSSSSSASITPSPKVGDLCVLPSPPCDWRGSVCYPCRPAPGECSALRALAGWCLMMLPWSGAVHALLLFAFSTRGAPVVSLCSLLSLCVLLSPASLLPLSLAWPPFPFLFLPSTAFSFPCVLASFPSSCPRPCVPPRDPSRWRSCCSLP